MTDLADIDECASPATGKSGPALEGSLRLAATMLRKDPAQRGTASRRPRFSASIAG